MPPYALVYLIWIIYKICGQIYIQKTFAFLLATSSPLRVSRSHRICFVAAKSVFMEYKEILNCLKIDRHDFVEKLQGSYHGEKLQAQLRSGFKYRTLYLVAFDTDDLIWSFCS
jgi:hypothetical protein